MRVWDIILMKWIKKCDHPHTQLDIIIFFFFLNQLPLQTRKLKERGIQKYQIFHILHFIHSLHWIWINQPMYIYMKETKTTKRRKSQICRSYTQNTFFTNMNMIVLSCWGLSDAAPILQLQREPFSQRRRWLWWCCWGLAHGAPILLLQPLVYACCVISMSALHQISNLVSSYILLLQKMHESITLKPDQERCSVLFYLIKMYILPGKYCIWCRPHPRPIQWGLLLMDMCFSSGTSTELLLRVLCSLNPSSLLELIIPVKHEQHLINRATKKKRRNTRLTDILKKKANLIWHVINI